MLLTAGLVGPAVDRTGGAPEGSGAHGEEADEVLLALHQFGGGEGHGKASRGGRDEDDEVLEARHVV